MGRVRVFDDLYSWFHFLCALLVTYLSPVAAIAATLIYIAYQEFEKEEWSSKRGDFIEWMVGILFGVILRSILLGA